MAATLVAGGRRAQAPAPRTLCPRRRSTGPALAQIKGEFSVWLLHTAELNAAGINCKAAYVARRAVRLMVTRDAIFVADPWRLGAESVVILAFGLHRFCARRFCKNKERRFRPALPPPPFNCADLG